MVQAHARELLNQKESKNAGSGAKVAPHPLFAASERLVAALNRLEGNLQHVTMGQMQDANQRQQLTLFERENESLRQERVNLNAAIEQLQHQYGDLHKVASTIYGKLDDSVKRLTKIIDN